MPFGTGQFVKIELPSPDFLDSFVFAKIGKYSINYYTSGNHSNPQTEVLVKKGFGDMMHACKTDWAMLVGSVFLLIKGGGHS